MALDKGNSRQGASPSVNAPSANTPGTGSTRVSSTLRSIRIRVELAILFLALFLIDAWLITTGRMQGIDNAVRLFAYGTRNSVTEAIMVPLTFTAHKYFIIGCIAVLLIVPGTRLRCGVPVGLSSGIALIPYRILKETFRRARPDPSMWLVTEHGFSFPSGHSMNGLIFYAMLIYFIRRSSMPRGVKNTLTALLVILIGVIGWSRIFCGVHYFSDVFGGWCIGLCWVMLLSCALDIRARRKEIANMI